MRTLMSAPPTDRVGRYPKHSFNISTRPFYAQPFMFAPVLPAETLQSMYFEARGVTDPVVNPIIGWRQEFYYFYCSMSSLLREELKNMFIDPANTDIAATQGLAANAPGVEYIAKGQVPFSRWAFLRVMETYFRDEDEAAPTLDADGRCPVQIKQDLFLDSLTDKDDMPEGAAIAAATDAGDLERLMNAFEYLRAMGLANMSYEDFLRSHGVSIPEAEFDRPEMLGRFADWQYPSNTVNPIDGAPASAVSWVFKQGAKDRKFFKEPGFIIGIAVTRPKVYLNGLYGSAAGSMTRAWDWMPALLASMPETKLKQFPAGTGPLGDRTTDTDAYWLDMADLLLYGDQFSTLVPQVAQPVQTVADNHGVPLPDTALNWRYITSAVSDAFFKDVNRKRIRWDGVTTLSIKGKQVDTTPGAAIQVPA